MAAGVQNGQGRFDARAAGVAWPLSGPHGQDSRGSIAGGGAVSWVEDVLRQWGGWYRVKGEAQGWGGAVDFDRLFELGRGTRAPGVHSDPILSEVLATEADQQADMQRVHRHIMQCARTLQLTARLRYAGLWLPVVGDPERGDRLRGGAYYRDSHGL